MHVGCEEALDSLIISLLLCHFFFGRSGCSGQLTCISINLLSGPVKCRPSTQDQGIHKKSLSRSLNPRIEPCSTGANRWTMVPVSFYFILFNIWVILSCKNDDLNQNITQRLVEDQLVCRSLISLLCVSYIGRRLKFIGLFAGNGIRKGKECKDEKLFNSPGPLSRGVLSSFSITHCDGT